MKLFKKVYILLLVSLTLMGTIISTSSHTTESTYPMQIADRGGGSGRGNG